MADVDSSNKSGDFIRISVLFFAKARELIGFSRRDDIPLPKNFSTTTIELKGSDLKELLISQFPALATIKNNFLLAVNLEYVDAEDTVQLLDGAEIAIIPPLSGG